MSPTLTASEIEAIRASVKMVAKWNSAIGDHGRVLFSSGGAESFAELWRQAEAVRVEVAG